MPASASTTTATASYDLTIDPTIVRSVQVQGMGGNIALYQQTEPAAVAAPDHAGAYQVRLYGGPAGYKLVLGFHDPQLRVWSVVAELATEPVFPGGDHFHRHTTNRLVIRCGAETIPPLHGVAPPPGDANAEPTVDFERSLVAGCGIRGPAGERMLYRQNAPYKLANQGHPRAHTIRLHGGPRGYDLALHVEDPQFRVARLEVEIAAGPAAGLAPGAVPETETLYVELGAETCPPICIDPLYD